MQHKYSIGWKIFTTFSIMMIALTLILGIAISKFANDMVTDSATNQLRVLSITLTNQVQKDLGRLETNFKNLGLNPELAKTLHFPPDDGADTEALLKSLPHTSQMISNLGVFNPAGKLIAATNYEWAAFLKPGGTYLKKGLKGFYFGDIFDGAKVEKKEQLVSAPIKEGGKIWGVLVGQVDLSKIFDLMDQNLPIGKTAEVFLIDAQLRFISSQHSDPLSLEPSHLMDTPLVKHLNDEFWVDRYQNFDDEDVLGTVRKIPEYNWYLGIERDYDSINDKAAGITQVIAFASLGIIAVMILISFYLTKSITRPILSLVEAAKGMSVGNFSHPVPNPGGNSYEITFLATEFESMRARVASQQLALKDRLEKSEMQRVQSERLAAIGALAASMAHEIRNPLNAMSLLLTQLELKLPTDKVNQQILHLRSEIKRLDQLVSGILDYAKPLQLEKTEVDLKKLLEHVQQIYQGVFDDRRINYHIDDPDPPVMIIGDKNRLQQCIVNIVQNAIDAMPDGGKIEVSTQIGEDGKARIVIKDTGTGISVDIRMRVFDLFYTTKKHGSGFGLATVRKIIEAHGGDILIEDCKPHGTSVTLILPIENQHR